MSVLNNPTQGMVFFSLIIKKSVDKQKLEQCFTKWSIHSQAQFDFNPSLEYYSREMGDKDQLSRYFLFGKNIDRSQLVDIKIWADQLEKDWGERTQNNKLLRHVNCDPGIICPEQVLLATGKSYAHRIYLDRGVYAELTYIYEDGAFKSLQWTYPDYQNEKKKEVFKLLRSRLIL